MLSAVLTTLAVLSVSVAGLLTATAARRMARTRGARRRATQRAQIRALVVEAIGLRPGRQRAATGDLRHLTRRHRDDVVDILTSVAATLGGESRPTVVALADTLHLTAELAASIHHPDPFRRIAAVETLGLLGGPDQTSAWHLAMRDDDPRVRVAAARSYLRTQPGAAGPAVLRMMTREDPQVAGELAELLSQAGTAVADALVTAWNAGTRTPQVVGLIARAADQTTCLAVLSDAATSPDPHVRRAALAALAHVPTALALPALTGATTDPDAQVRAEAASALGVVAGPGSLPVLIAMLDDPAWAVRHRAAAALANTPDGPRLLASLLGQATPFVTTAITTALQRAVTSGGILAGLVDPDPATTARAERAARALAVRAEMAQVLQAAAERHPDPRIRSALARIIDATRIPDDLSRLAAPVHAGAA